HPRPLSPPGRGEQGRRRLRPKTPPSRHRPPYAINHSDFPIGLSSALTRIEPLTAVEQSNAHMAHRTCKGERHDIGLAWGQARVHGVVVGEPKGHRRTRVAIS